MRAMAGECSVKFRSEGVCEDSEAGSLVTAQNSLLE